ncbi:UNVERIFIED_CONTAM: hypothetical protein Slati_3914800 [Sesamum latifolium]|uniref:Uncharacterized protein n=1 Tax=Sesamum latifolium TaxID=2727402 RepID=A0AAW2TNL0_9LAMI
MYRLEVGFSWTKVIVPPQRRAYLRGALLGARLRNLVGRIIRCPPEAGFRWLRGGGLRCLHGTELTSSPEKDLGACPNEGWVPPRRRVSVPVWKTGLFMRRCLPRSRTLIREI